MSLITKLKKNYQAGKWYQQGGAVKPLYIGFAHSRCFHLTLGGKKIPVFYKDTTCYYRHDFFDVFFPMTTMKQVSGFYFKNGQDQVGIDKYFRIWLKQAERFGHLVRAMENQKLVKLNNLELTGLFKNFAKDYLMLWGDSIFHDAFDAVGDELLNNQIKKEKNKFFPAEIHLLTAADSLSWAGRQKYDLLNLFKIANSKNGLSGAVIKRDLKAIKNKYPIFARALERHQQQYHWLNNDYAIIEQLDERYFLNELAGLVKNLEEKNKLVAELRELSGVGRQRKSLIARKKPSSELLNLSTFLVVVAKWRDERKAYSQMADWVLKKIVSELAKRKRLKLADIEYLFWWEALKIFDISDEFVKKLYGLRFKSMFTYGDPQKDEIIYGQNGNNLREILINTVAQRKGISGMPAYPGLVKGKIRIVRDQKEFKKMKPGDILLAPNTRPEYVPIMKIAGAILSEEGGVTSHSAIISRELKIPCIVGVQGAIAKLKDGDLVEVDADKGVVKLIKK